jgi:cytoskeletal protein CcmA (bactofilin family)
MFQKFGRNFSHSGSAHGSVLSVIASDVRIVGDIIAQGEIQVDGRVDGDIVCTTLVVGEGARISGEVTAGHVKVHGELVGKINASIVSIARSASVSGDVTHESLEIEAGARLEGHCIRKAPPVETKCIESLPAMSTELATVPV